MHQTQGPMITTTKQIVYSTALNAEWVPEMTNKTQILLT